MDCSSRVTPGDLSHPLGPVPARVLGVIDAFKRTVVHALLGACSCSLNLRLVPAVGVGVEVEVWMEV